MKLLYVITGLGMGGAENQVSNLIDKMVTFGHEVTLISLTGPTIVKPSSKSVSLYEIHMSKSPRSVFKAIRIIRRVIRTYQPDVVHTHMIHSNILVRLVRVFTPMKKLVCTAHSTTEGGRLISWCYRVTNFLGDVFTNVSQNAVESFIEKKIVKSNEMICVYNGIDTNKFKYSISDNIRYRSEFKISLNCSLLLSVGSFNSAKDYPNLLQALKIIVSEGALVHLIIIGDGPLRDHIENLIKSLDLESYVSLLGVRKDVASFMSAADYFILPSKWEGFGLVVAEAMSCQCPVIATDSGGVKEVLGGHGELVYPSDSVDLAGAIIRMMNAPAPSIERLKQNAMEHVIANYSLDNITSQWLQIYK